MNTLKYTAIFALVTLMTGCSKTEEAEGVIPEHQLKALESAKNVELMLKNADDKRRQEIEEIK
ncbi:hypothetical protein [Dasania marina]|uniref:hypothetical protein n=1 Tax=Dasania marina TaxID=471499 RepID=UPI0030D7DEA6|tara:strand:+ start:7494 stop:7682 length:189 start_codon:yes stop_codon:yes gene_type:complete